jgi:N-acetylmuramic acid 6-phosphate etherase
MNFDKMSSAEQVAAMCRENQNAVLAVEKAAPEIAKAIDAVAAAFNGGHRLFFIGAGTSGRLGVLDAAECPPTFGVPHDMVQGIIAGGKERMFSAGENAEDKLENGIADIKASQLSAGDVLVGVSVAGGAAYVVGALQTAKELGATAVALTSNFDTPIEKVADITIITDTGAEVVTGSTRMKAGTAQKLVLNMLSTAVMIKTGKVYENLMVNLRPTIVKLRYRMITIVMNITGLGEEDAERLLNENEWSIPRAADAWKASK